MLGFGTTRLCIPVLALLALLGASPVAAQDFSTEKHSLRVFAFAAGLEFPWSIAFLPDGRMLVTERPGRLRIVDHRGRVSAPLRGLPTAYTRDTAGFLDVAVDPQFARNRLIYLAYAEGDDNAAGLALGRGILDGGQVRDFRLIYRQRPKARSSWSFGARIVVAPNGHIFLTLGDLNEKHRVQDFFAMRGQVIRITRDGAPAPGNPSSIHRELQPETWSVGHRNSQGAALHPLTRELWIHEHGEVGGDELNVVQPGRNYGWPLISYSRAYEDGGKIGVGTHMAGLEQPVYQWTPAVAPSGMAFYTGGRFPAWRGNLFIGALGGTALIRLELEGRKVIREERILRELGERIRDVRQGPDGLLYLLTDSPQGRILRLDPVPSW